MSWTQKKKLLLVYPKNLHAHYSDTQAIQVLGKRGSYLSATLATIAALTPPEFEIRIVDENVEPLPLNETYDLVGITGSHFHLSRAREIARDFSKRGAVVVCGGPSVSLSMDRWRSFADVLIIGEAERTWPQFLMDYLAGCHQQEYRETERIDLSISPIPDYGGVSKKIRKEFLIGVVQTSRGCPHDCEFCSVHVYLGHKIRYKPVDRIIQEVEQIQRQGLKIVFLSDDNFTGGRKALTILRALRDWNRQQRRPMSFITQLSIDAARDKEFLELAAVAGLNMVYIGIESPNVESLKETKKLQNLKSDMIEDIRLFHQHGIQVVGSTVVGFDHDDLSVFQRQLDFFMKAGVPKVHVYPLQANDGTRLKERMIEENRYIDFEMLEDSSLEENPKYTTLEHLTIIPKKMTLEQLRQGTYWLVWNLYKPESLLERLKVFFDEYDNSSRKERLALPRQYFDMERVAVVLRVLKYFVLEASTEDRRFFLQMMKLARGSSLPRRFEIVLVEYFMAQKIHEILRRQNPKIDRITYPQAHAHTAPAQQFHHKVR